jgi:hypothetical protein
VVRQITELYPGICPTCKVISAFSEQFSNRRIQQLATIKGIRPAADSTVLLECAPLQHPHQMAPCVSLLQENVQYELKSGDPSYCPGRLRLAIELEENKIYNARQELTGLEKLLKTVC